METVRLARNAMATRFEIVLHGERGVALHSAAEEALDEVSRLSCQLNFYDGRSEISRINRIAWKQPVKVEPQLFNLLLKALELFKETQGVFDITLAPLMKCWGFMRDTGRFPSDMERQTALDHVGIDRLQFNIKDRTIQYPSPGFMMDLGGIGKGFAIDLAAEILRDAGVTSALIHGGTSSAYAIGHPPDQDSWKIAITPPPDSDSSNTLPPSPVGVVSLVDTAFSMSAVWGKAFESDGKTYGHVIDPRTGYPTQGACLSAVVLPSATEADAMSTALLVGGEKDFPWLSQLRKDMSSLIGMHDGTGESLRLISKGIKVLETK